MCRGTLGCRKIVSRVPPNFNLMVIYWNVLACKCRQMLVYLTKSATIQKRLRNTAKVVPRLEKKGLQDEVNE